MGLEFTGIPGLQVSLSRMVPAGDIGLAGYIENPSPDRRLPDASPVRLRGTTSHDEKGTTMFNRPKRMLVVAGVCAVLFFLLGAPEITDNPGPVQQVALWLQFGTGIVGVAALALSSMGLFARRTSRQ